MVNNQNCLKIKAAIAAAMARSAIEFINQARLDKAEAYIQELIDEYNQSFWGRLNGSISRDSFDEALFNPGQSFQLHLIRNCLLEKEEKQAIEIESAAKLAIRLDGQDAEIFITSAQASILYRMGGD